MGSMVPSERVMLFMSGKFKECVVQMEKIYPPLQSALRADDKQFGTTLVKSLCIDAFLNMNAVLAFIFSAQHGSQEE